MLPLLEREFNPTIVENFAELAEIARDEEDYWENEISGGWEPWFSGPSLRGRERIIILKSRDSYRLIRRPESASLRKAQEKVRALQISPAQMLRWWRTRVLRLSENVG